MKTAQLCFALLSALALSAKAQARPWYHHHNHTNTACINGQCTTCENSSLVCTLESCQCVDDSDSQTSITVNISAKECGHSPARMHRNGGGLVENSARVDESVFVESGSIVCGRADIAGNVRIVDKSVVGGVTNVEGRSIVKASRIDGVVRIEDSLIENSKIGGVLRFQNSTVKNSNLRGVGFFQSQTITNENRDVTPSVSVEIEN